MNPRYFIGITLPDELTSKIETIQIELLTSQDVMKPLVPHITLLHPNILMTLAPMYFVPIVKEAAKEFLPLSIELTEIALFDTRVLYIAIKSPELVRLQEKLVGLLPEDIRAGHQIGREYKPHITIAQAKPLQSLSDELIARLEQELTPLLPLKLEITFLSYFTSSGPRIYKPRTI